MSSICGVVSDAATQALVSPHASLSFAIDATAPTVVFLGGPSTGTTLSVAAVTLNLTCGNATANTEPSGCQSITWRLVAAPSGQAGTVGTAVPVNGTTALWWTSVRITGLVNGDVVAVVASAVDAAGNAGPNYSLSFTVDTTPPTATFVTRQPAHTRYGTASFSLGCDKAACRYEYAVDGQARVAVGAGGGGGGGSTGPIVFANVSASKRGRVTPALNLEVMTWAVVNYVATASGTFYANYVQWRMDTDDVKAWLIIDMGVRDSTTNPPSRVLPVRVAM